MHERMARLEELLLREIAEFVAKSRGGGIPGIITFTRVILDKDLQAARVFYSVLGSSLAQEEMEHALMGMRRAMVAHLRKRLHLKRIPSILFRFDASPAHAAGVETIFEKIRTEEKPHDQPDGEPGTAA
ncbi:MAG: ribosome-binding factor A [Elusimicrobiaceae bacterium]